MAAPSIPNLNSLKGRTGLRGRGRGRGLGDASNPSKAASGEDEQTSRDKIIQQTDGDASSSRMSAVALAYLDDVYARPFIQGQIARRYPIINRGTYVRTTAIDRLVDQFLAAYPNVAKQIISLGAGSDTRFFRRKHVRHLIYHEIDFASNTAQKIAVLERTPALLDAIHATLASPSELRLNEQKTALSSPTFNIHPLDLRTLISDAPDSPKAGLPNLDPTLPTLLLSECCLCYLDPDTTVSILQHLASTLVPAPTPLAIVLYEPIRPYDSFGRTMVTNLASRGIHLQTLKRYYSLRAQRERLRSAGFVSGQGGRDVEAIYYGLAGEQWISVEERTRVEGLEWLDEVEEWKLLAKHYCVAWGWRDGAEDVPGSDVFSKAWADIKGTWTDGERGDDQLA